MNADQYTREWLRLKLPDHAKWCEQNGRDYTPPPPPAAPTREEIDAAVKAQVGQVFPWLVDPASKKSKAGETDLDKQVAAAAAQFFDNK